MNIWKIVSILVVFFSFTGLAQAESKQFTSTYWVEVSTEQGAPNLGITTSESGINVSANALVRHQSGAIAQFKIANGNDTWQSQSEIAVGYLTKVFDGKLTVRADAYVVFLENDVRNEQVESLRLMLITNKGVIKPYLFTQQFLSGPPGEGTTVRPGVKLPLGFYAEAGFHHELFNQDGWTHSFNRVGWTGPLPVIEGWKGLISRVEAVDTPVQKDRTEVTIRYDITF